MTAWTMIKIILCRVVVKKVCLSQLTKWSKYHSGYLFNKKRGANITVGIYLIKKSGANITMAIYLIKKSVYGV